MESLERYKDNFRSKNIEELTKERDRLIKDIYDYENKVVRYDVDISSKELYIMNNQCLIFILEQLLNKYTEDTLKKDNWFNKIVNKIDNKITELEEQERRKEE